VAAHREDATVTFDVNVRPALIPDRDSYHREINQWLDTAHIVKASDDDLAWLYPGQDPIDVARRWIDEHDLTLVLVTAGPAGAVAVPRGQDPVRAAGVAVEVVDTVGAGDTFTAAFLHRLAGFDQQSLASALRFAVVAAALACTREGAQPPTLDEVEKALGDVPPSPGTMAPAADPVGG
jgi:fructokinase